MSSITRVLLNLRAATWDYFICHLPKHFHHSLKVVKEAIMTDINDLVQEFWSASTDGTDRGSIFAMRLLHEILRRCFEVCFFLRPPST